MEVEKFVVEEEPLVVYLIPSSSPAHWIAVYEEPGSVECWLLKEGEKVDLVKKLSGKEVKHGV